MAKEPVGYDFSGWATYNDLKCADGRVIRRDAFKGNDGRKVPLVWNHQHNDPENVLGHALLENREEGVYAYGFFNKTPKALAAKEQVEHGDYTTLSIFANNLRETVRYDGSDVIHGVIRELSLVLAGANPGAFIDNVILHGDGIDGFNICYDEGIILAHSEVTEEDSPAVTESNPSAGTEPGKTIEEEKGMATPNLSHAATGADATIEDVVNTMTEDQKTAMYAIIGMALEEAAQNGGNVSHNAFENEPGQVIGGGVLTHDMQSAILADAKKYGSLRDSFIAHADTYGVTNIDYLFPDAQALENAPAFISRQMTWVQKVINGTHHTPFSRIKSLFADITEDEARAKGYIKGALKKEEVFSLLKRTTSPTTIYKKQKLDRDDVIDITDFDIVAWLKTEMRMMLDEEIARAILVGDGRLNSSDEKIKEDCIRPIWKDEALFSVNVVIPTPTFEVGATQDDKDAAMAKAFINAAIKNRKKYKGSGNPVLFTTEDVVTNCLLLEDSIGRKIYPTVSELATTLRVSEIITVEVMDGLTRTVDAATRALQGIMVNLSDYNVGADKGGAVNMFDDFDIDYNQQKYLIETRCSGALVKPFSALVFETVVA